jgi:pimeloyl-ACP methyl ester carboxylesterase
MCALALLAAASNRLSAQPLLESRVIALGDAQIEVRLQGSGDAVVVLSGVGADVSYLDGFGQVLVSHGLQALAINPRAAGRSEGPLTGLSLTDYATDVAGCLDALDVSKATVLGFGGGNRVARRLAVIRPDLVDGLVLVAAGGLVPGDPEALALMELWAGREAPISQRIAAFRASMLSPATDPELLDAPIVDPVAFQAQMAALNATPLDDWWSGGSAEMLVLQGEDDLIAPAGNGRALEDEFGDRVRLVNIPDAGHMLLVEQSNRVAQELLAFIDRTRQ